MDDADAPPASAPTKRVSVAADSTMTDDTDTTNGITSTHPTTENGAAPRPLSFQYPQSFLLRIPKSDLHVHLDGSIRVSTLIDLAREQDLPLPSFDAEELERTVFPETYSSLEEYLRGFGYITTVLRTPEALERVAYEVASDAFDVGVRYLE